MTDLRKDCDYIVSEALRAVQPKAAVRKALETYRRPKGRLILISVGKAAWAMAEAAQEILGDRVDRGVVITKHGHAMGAIADWEICEASHPVPDETSFSAAKKAWDATADLSENDGVIFLLSGGGSALFELPAIPAEELQDITQQLLACGADIVEMNTIRKRLSHVKGGRFAEHCAPAQVFEIVLSDIVGDPLDMIASGPAYPDGSTCAQANAIAQKYELKLSDAAKAALQVETPKTLDNITVQITGSVRELCAAAASACEQRGYVPQILTASLTCEAREAGAFLAAIARTFSGQGKRLAFLAGGETVVHLTGHGMGGRNQELALSAADGIETCAGTAIFSVGSDGTDGPTDAAGGFVTSETKRELAQKNLVISAVLRENDAYHALAACDGLIVTGPTGTNVNDVAVLLIQG